MRPLNLACSGPPRCSLGRTRYARRALTFALWLKFLLAPLLVAGASLAGRRFGQRVGGLTAALPLVGGPLLVFYTLDHGAAFAARAAEQALSGIFSLSAYCLTYGWLAWTLRGASHRWRPLALPLAWTVFGACTWLFFRWAPAGPEALLLGVLGLALGETWLPRLPEGARQEREACRSVPYWTELLARMLVTALLVGSLSVASGALGPELSGLLTPFPVASTVLVVATHLTDGPADTIVLLRGFLFGMRGFVAFCAAVAWGALPLGPGPGFGLGLLGVAVVQWMALAKKTPR